MTKDSSQTSHDSPKTFSPNVYGEITVPTKLVPPHNRRKRGSVALKPLLPSLPISKKQNQIFEIIRTTGGDIQVMDPQTQTHLGTFQPTWQTNNQNYNHNQEEKEEEYHHHFHHHYHGSDEKVAVIILDGTGKEVATVDRKHNKQFKEGKGTSDNGGEMAAMHDSFKSLESFASSNMSIGTSGSLGGDDGEDCKKYDSSHLKVMAKFPLHHDQTFQKRRTRTGPVALYTWAHIKRTRKTRIFSLKPKQDRYTMNLCTPMEAPKRYAFTTQNHHHPGENDDDNNNNDDHHHNHATKEKPKKRWFQFPSNPLIEKSDRKDQKDDDHEDHPQTTTLTIYQHAAKNFSHKPPENPNIPLSPAVKFLQKSSQESPCATVQFWGGKKNNQPCQLTVHPQTDPALMILFLVSANQL